MFPLGSVSEKLLVDKIFGRGRIIANARQNIQDYTLEVFSENKTDMK